MTKYLIALMTFLLGVWVFSLLHLETITVPEVVAPIQINVEIPQIQTFDSPIQKAGDSKPFFNSFREDERYSGWLIADKFKGMKEVWTILLRKDSENFDDENLDGQNLNNQNLVWSAMVLTMNADGESNDDDNFHSVQMITNGSHLSFRTNKVRGIEYKFDGEFSKTGNDFSDNEKVLKGTLEKIVKGKTIAKFTADFAYNEPHCFQISLTTNRIVFIKSKQFRNPAFYKSQ